MILYAPTRTVFTALCLCLVLFGPSAPATATELGSRLISNDPGEVTVLYGGFGYLTPQGQPYLSEIIGRVQDGTTTPLSAYPDLHETLINRARAIAEGTRLAVSTDPPIVGREALGRKLAPPGTNPTDADVGRQLTDLLSATKEKQVVVLSLVGSLEMMVDLGQDDSFEEHYYTSVSALLTVPQTGNVVMVGGRATDYIVRTRPPKEVRQSPEAEQKRKAANFAYSYQLSMEGAMKRLAALAARHGVLDAPRHMVTAVALQDARLQRLFHMKPTVIRSLADICTPGPVCPDDNSDNARLCSNVEGLLAQGLTNALSSAGLSVLPALTWRSWAATSESVVLQLAGGLDAAFDKMTITVKAQAAERQLVASVAEIMENSVPGANQYLSTRFIKTFVRVMWVDSDCQSIRAKNVIEDSSLVQLHQSASEAGRPLETERAKGIYIARIFSTLEGMEHHVDSLKK